MTETNDTESPAKQKWIDSHCHLTAEQFQEDAPEVISRAREAGVGKIIVIGDGIEASRASVELASGHEGLRATAGIHPHNAGNWSESVGEELRGLCRENMANINLIVGLGEIGLDFFYDYGPRDAQLRAFADQAEIARELRLPLVMHCRDAYPEFIALIRENDIASVGGVVHCFSGDLTQARELIDLGFFLGIGGALTFKKNETGREVVRGVPLESLVIETDAPYLAPVPKRGKRNEPALMLHTAQRLAQETNTPIDQLAETLWANTHRLFRLED